MRENEEDERKMPREKWAYKKSRSNPGPRDVCFVMVQIEVVSAVLQMGIMVCRKKSRLAGEIPCLMTIP